MNKTFLWTYDVLKCVWVVRYLFNVGEGAQRMCCETKIKLKGIGAVFLATLSPLDWGGLPGVYLALSDLG